MECRIKKGTLQTCNVPFPYPHSADNPISLRKLAEFEKPENKGFLISNVAYMFYTVDYSGHSTTSVYLQVNIFYYPKGATYD